VLTLFRVEGSSCSACVSRTRTVYVPSERTVSPSACLGKDTQISMPHTHASASSRCTGHSVFMSECPPNLASGHGESALKALTAIGRVAGRVIRRILFCVSVPRRLHRWEIRGR
jgi:hypothetical protein